MAPLESRTGAEGDRREETSRRAQGDAAEAGVRGGHARKEEGRGRADATPAQASPEGPNDRGKTGNADEGGARQDARDQKVGNGRRPEAEAGDAQGSPTEPGSQEADRRARDGGRERKGAATAGRGPQGCPR